MEEQQERHLGNSFDFEAISYPKGWEFKIVETGKSYVADKTAQDDPYKVVKIVDGRIVDTYDLARLQTMRDKILERMNIKDVKES